ncbi:MAG: bifunctional 2-polyprenyl-6-hydroxyphenol methylase/3-demethylubiquinol 3-O-methyltransferase UbiG [Alphaproteobacteria bacterium]|nr:bifunctional 2-polyprenyl-6-hydroxyphenol methylase/3-demethylubiquinol 3-O-methyltransferase UbiG [Alphaproteobacteria bacterium]
MFQVKMEKNTESDHNNVVILENQAPDAPDQPHVMPHSPSIDPKQIDTFNAYEGDPWDEKGPLKPLHQLNPVRVQFIRDHIQRIKRIGSHQSPVLEGLNVLDVGCGPGLLCEPLSRLGANVTGIDASDHFISVAKNHAEKNALDITYQLSSVEDLVNQGKKYDVVCVLEVVEHVSEADRFLNHCMELVADDGVLFISTLNRTIMSYLKAIILAENILKWIPIGTHQWKKFLTPSEIAEVLQNQQFYFTDIQGIDYNILNRQWSLTPSLSTNYIGCAVKR